MSMDSVFDLFSGEAGSSEAAAALAQDAVDTAGGWGGAAAEAGSGVLGDAPSAWGSLAELGNGVAGSALESSGGLSSISNALTATGGGPNNWFVDSADHIIPKQSPWTSLMGTVEGNSTKLKDLVSSGTSLYSGIKGISAANRLEAMSKRAGSTSDSWGASGGRGVADAQLQALLKNPSQTASADPAYALRIQAAQRATATMGQNSGAMAKAGADASTSWYDQRLQQLSGLAGAGGTGAQAAQIELSGLGAAAELGSKGLASVGYGLTRAGGNNMPPQVQQWMKSQGWL